MWNTIIVITSIFVLSYLIVYSIDIRNMIESIFIGKKINATTEKKIVIEARRDFFWMLKWLFYLLLYYLLSKFEYLPECKTEPSNIKREQNQ